LDAVFFYSAVLGLGTALSFGFADFLVKVALGRADFRTVLFGAIVLSLPLSAATVLVLDPAVPPSLFSPAIIVIILASNALGAASWYLFFRAVEKGRVSVVSSLAALYALVTVFLGIAFLSEPMSPFLAVAACLAAAGTVLAGSETGGGGLPVFGTGLEVRYGLSAAALFGVATFLSVIVVRAIGPYWDMLAGRLLLAAFFLALFHKPVVHALPRLFFGKHAVELLAIAVLYWLAPLLANISFKVGTPSVSTPVAATSPVFTALLGIFVLRERLSRAQLAGIAMVVAAIVLISI
jgi:drug/metabolite transporter (DMT)-like permease